MSSAKRILAATIGLPILLTLPACGGAAGYGDSTGGGNAVAATGTPTPTADPSDAVNGVGLEEPVGIPTDKLIAKRIPKMGEVVTDAKGWLLYRFDRDSANPPVSNCTAQCAVVWPPVLTDGNPTLEGIDRSKVGTITREDGSTQLTLGGWALYRYIGDPKPGAWKGQMVNGTWFVSAPDGKRNLSCLPTATPQAVAPPAEADPAGTPDTGSGSGNGY